MAGNGRAGIVLANSTYWMAYAAMAAAVAAASFGGRARLAATVLVAVSVAFVASQLLVARIVPPEAPPVARATAPQPAPAPVALPANPGLPLQPAVPGLPDGAIARFEGPIPQDLRPLSREELRLVAYTLSARLGDLLSEYLTALTASRDLTPEDATTRRAQLDAALNRTFRADYEPAVFRVGHELQRRHGIASEVLELTNAVFTWADIADAQYRIAQSATQLP